MSQPPPPKPSRGDYWRHLFAHWPADLAKSGAVITEHNEPVRFIDFAVSGGLLLLQRDRPDTTGARKVFVSYDAISSLKLDDPGELDRYRALGFQPPVGAAAAG
ncbi:hypothetical protein [Alienimonas californiensis]|uniref:Uncharacterized protein n=1 Tax=Alienimonas californiensis TaxID=2527989 RepID=A0A517PDQ9_9PLAN|nr:hypothetical protein [Alienimonas californiensis]QDT17489.1 hypothetical protein CA12_36150 [Alienimonas californiensis]